MLRLTTVTGVEQQPATTITHIYSHIYTQKKLARPSTVHVTHWSENARRAGLKSEGDKDWVRQVHSGVILRRPRNFQQKRSRVNVRLTAQFFQCLTYLHTTYICELLSDTTLLSAIYSTLLFTTKPAEETL